MQTQVKKDLEDPCPMAVFSLFLQLKKREKPSDFVPVLPGQTSCMEQKFVFFALVSHTLYLGPYFL